MSDASRYFCRKCRYELTGLAHDDAGQYPVCPECGAVFRPGDPKTTTPTPHSRLHRFATSRLARLLIIVALLYTGLLTNVLPHPVIPIDGTSINWSHWVWLDADLGTQRFPASFSPAGRSPTWAQWEIDWRWGRVHGVRVVDPSDGAIYWQVRRLKGQQFELDVNIAGISWSELFTGFNAVRRPEELFGITVRTAANASNPKPFSARGQKQAVLGAIIREYGLKIESYIVPQNGGQVWVFDEDKAEMRLIGAETAFEMGYEPIRNDNAELPRPFDR